MKCVFYKNNSDNRKVNKNLTQVYSTNIKLKLPSTIMDPVITCSRFSEDINANYVYIEGMGFYFIVNKTLALGNIIEFSLHDDVLQNYSDNIRNLFALVERNEFLYDDFLVDNEIIVNETRMQGNQKFGITFTPNYIDDTHNRIILNVCNLQS